MNTDPDSLTNLPLSPAEIAKELVLTEEQKQAIYEAEFQEAMADAPEDWNRPPTDAEINELARYHETQHRNPGRPHEL